jgi:hypothetical protein
MDSENIILVLFGHKKDARLKFKILLIHQQNFNFFPSIFVQSASVDEKPSEGQEDWTWTWRDVKPLNTIVLIYLHIATVYSFFNLPHCWQTYLLQFLILLGAGKDEHFENCFFFQKCTFNNKKKLMHENNTLKLVEGFFCLCII